MGAPVAEPFAVVFECSGHASALEAALGQLDYAGTLVIVGTGFVPPRINQNRLIIFELEIVGAYNYNDDGFQPAVDLLNSGTLPLESLIEPDDIPLSEVMDLDGTALPRRDPQQGDGPTGTVDMSRDDLSPRINHVAISVDADVLNDEGRADAPRLLLRGLRMDRGRQQHGKGQPPDPLYRGVAPVPLPAAGEGRIHGHSEHGPLRDGGVLQGGVDGNPGTGHGCTSARTTASASPKSAPW